MNGRIPPGRKSIPSLVLFLALALPPLAGCPPPDPWRSTLYPEGWEPGFQDSQGRFLHDFSYAGYHQGASLPVLPPGDTYNALDFGADGSGLSDSTAGIQAAIQAASAAGGGIVFLPAGLYRCDGLLAVTASGVVIRGEGPSATRLYFTLATGMSDRAHITFRGTLQQSPDLPLAEDGENRSFAVSLVDASTLQAGDEVSLGWIITDDFIAEHGMTGTWLAFNGQWKPFFRREVSSLDLSGDPDQVQLDVPLRYQAKLRDQASIRKETGYLAECGIERLSVANAVSWEDAWNEERVHLIDFVNARDCWMREVETFETPYAPGSGYHLQNGGVKILSCKRITVSDCRLEKAQNRGDGGCGYLFEVSKSSEVLVRDCQGIGGRHNFIQNWDFGTSGCVFLRCESSEGRCLVNKDDPIGYRCDSEYHHSLAMACLVDQCTVNDGWYGGNRQDWSSGAGLTVTESAYWNLTGSGQIRSWQYGWGYVIGTQGVILSMALGGVSAEGTEPQDYLEGQNLGAALLPQSLYEDQRTRRIGP